jgi:predicted AAA+ superfamily ATPase
MEDPDVISRLRADPQGFLEEVRLPAILDEIQNVPEILNYARVRIDRQARKKGQWLFTGSQEAPLMQGVTESMAGRAAVFQLLPLSRRESPKVTLLKGGFPEPVAHPAEASLWFRSYVQTYLERDVRSITSVRDLATFRRFLALLASRCGQMLNKTDLAAPLGVSVPTITEWLSILEITGQVLLVPPFYENFGKRLVKSPKLYFLDSGLLCHLLGVDNQRLLNRSPFLGPIFEGFVASEIVKQQIAAGRPRALYYFRDQQGLEVDFLVPRANEKVWLIEAKASRTVKSAMAEPLVRLDRAMSDRAAARIVVFRGANDDGLSAIYPGVRALAVDEFLSELGPPSRPRRARTA